MSEEPASVPGEITRLLSEVTEGNLAAIDNLLPLVYADLRRIARRQLAREQPGHTLDSVALVNEAYLKLVDQAGLRWESRAHFFGIASRAMRTLLVDYARAHKAAKRGDGRVAVGLEGADAIAADGRADYLLALDEALTRLGGVDEDAARIVECRYFAGLTVEETAAVLDRSTGTVRSRWRFAKRWLKRELTEP